MKKKILLKNFEWNVSLISKDNLDSYNDALIEFELLWNKTLELDTKLIEKYRLQLDYAIEKWDMDYVNAIDEKIKELNSVFGFINEAVIERVYNLNTMEYAIQGIQNRTIVFGVLSIFFRLTRSDIMKKI